MGRDRDHSEHSRGEVEAEEFASAAKHDPEAIGAAGKAAVSRLAAPAGSLSEWAAESRARYKAEKAAAEKDVPDFGSYNPMRQREGVAAFVAFVTERHGRDVVQGSREHAALLHQLRAAYDSLNVYQRSLVEPELDRLQRTDSRPDQPMSYYNIQVVLGIKVNNTVHLGVRG